ncbi:hypothetical protein MHU86_13564 [Fragilaria crotonensis]|nr:hypothetical protein MHU86_13564 [Fragilaria crotonensis]
MFKGFGMRKYGLRVAGLLGLTTLCMLCAVQVSVLGWGLVFDARPCERHQLPLLESHYLPFLPFDDSALHPAPYTDDETDIDRLLKLCHNGDSLMITAQFQASGDTARSVYERTCFPLEIATAQGARSMGHCSDFVQYIYFAGARLSDDYGAEAILQHARQCPNSSFLHGEYPQPDVFKLPGVRNYWMPNIEQVNKEQEELIPLTYRFLGKTHKAVEVIRDYLKKHSLPDTTRFISHTSPDPLTPRARQTERNFDSFYHGYGHSGRKSTPELLQCWASNPSFPTLTVLGRNSCPSIKTFRILTLLRELWMWTN